MNIQTVSKILASLACLTELSADSLSLKQKLDLAANNPREAEQINIQIAQAVCCDWETFSQIVSFCLRAMMQNNPQNLPLALQHCERIARESLAVQ